MRTYTVEVTWRVSEYAHLIVKAETPEAAMAKALECSESGLPSKFNRAEDQEGDIQILKDPEYDYESNLGRDRVTGIWDGEEAYPKNAVTLPLPPTPEEDLEAAIETLLREVDPCLRGGTAPLSVTRPAEALREARGALMPPLPIPRLIANRALAIQQSANRSMRGVFNVRDTHDPDHPTIVELYPESLTPLPET